MALTRREDVIATDTLVGYPFLESLAGSSSRLRRANQACYNEIRAGRAHVNQLTGRIQGGVIFHVVEASFLGVVADLPWIVNSRIDIHVISESLRMSVLALAIFVLLGWYTRASDRLVCRNLLFEKLQIFLTSL